MRRVGGTRRKVQEERLVWCSRLLLPDPTDRLLGDGLGEVPLRVVVRHLDRSRVLEERRIPLVRFAALEPVEVVEPLARRPPIVGAAGTEFVVGRVVPFAEGGGGVLITLEYFRNTRRFPRPLPVVTGKTSRELGDAPSVHRVMIAAREQRSPCRRAERGRVEAVVP